MRRVVSLCYTCPAALTTLFFSTRPHIASVASSSQSTKITRSHTAAVDLGGTKLLCAVMDDSQQVLASAKASTDVSGGPDAIIKQMAKGIRRALKKAGLQLKNVGAVGACVPGPADPASGVVRRAVNLHWENPVPLADQLSLALKGVPVVIENDVNAGTYGEWVAGAAKGKRDVIGIFVGTGIGGGLVLDGKLRRGTRFIAGEVGHIVLKIDGPPCSCGNAGCAEALASRSALERSAWVALKAGRKSMVTEMMESKGRERMTSGIINRAYRAGDPLMVELVEDMAFHLGLLTASLVNILDPQMVVFGGGVVEKMGEDLLALVRSATFGKLMTHEEFSIQAAQLDDMAGVIGAAALARAAVRCV